MRILSYTIEEYIDLAKSFHGVSAPGIVIGGFMVNRAVRDIPDGVVYDAICETRTCLPDSIQLLTPCTIGNGWLTVVHLGRFALTLYDKQTKEGARVFLDAGKLWPWPGIRNWFLKTKPKGEQDPDSLVREILEAGERILGIQQVRIRPGLFEKKHKKSVDICPRCGEAYPAEDGRVCLACQGNSPYLDRP